MTKSGSMFGNLTAVDVSGMSEEDIARACLMTINTAREMERRGLESVQMGLAADARVYFQRERIAKTHTRRLQDELCRRAARDP